MANWQRLLDTPHPHAHFVQLYTDDEMLSRNVGRYLCEGLRQGENGIVIATPAHRAAFRRNLESRGIDSGLAEQEHRLVFLDAEQTLARFVMDDVPNRARFEDIICAAVRCLRRDARIRAYGEMVGVLWASGQYSAATTLEECWNRVLSRLGATLFCSYPIDLFGREFEAKAVHAILCDHTHLLPADTSGILEAALTEAVNEVAGLGRGGFTPEPTAECPPGWGAVPPAERLILWVRNNLPNAADEIFRRARRDYAQRTAAGAS
jgi:hypothetical protein